jgi:hypothetical protein
LTIGLTVVPEGPAMHVSQQTLLTRGPRVAWISSAAVVARSLAMVALAAFAILVLLPAALAAQATLPI